MARFNLYIVGVLVVIACMVAVECADKDKDKGKDKANSTTTPAPSATTAKPSKHQGILETIETFISAIPVGLATACETGSKAVEDFFTNPWW